MSINIPDIIFHIIQHYKPLFVMVVPLASSFPQLWGSTSCSPWVSASTEVPAWRDLSANHHILWLFGLWKTTFVFTGKRLTISMSIPNSNLLTWLKGTNGGLLQLSSHVGWPAELLFRWDSEVESIGPRTGCWFFPPVIKHGLLEMNHRNRWFS